MHPAPRKSLPLDLQEVEDRLAEMLNEKQRRKEQKEMAKCMKEIQLEYMPQKKQGKR